MAQVELPKNQFNSVIRMVLRSETARVSAVRAATYVALKRLGAKRNLTRAIRKVPGGSDQFDVGTLVTWLGRIGLGDVAAIDQLIRIDATAVSRT